MSDANPTQDPPQQPDPNPDPNPQPDPNQPQDPAPATPDAPEQQVVVNGPTNPPGTDGGSEDPS